MNLKNDIKGIGTAVDNLVDKAEPSGSESKEPTKEGTIDFEQIYFNSFKKLRERSEQHFDAMLNKLSNEIKIEADISKKVEAIKALKREIKELKSRL